MSKSKYIVRCQVCGYSSPKWMGRCPDCGQWNTMVEELVEPGFSFSKNPVTLKETAVALTNISCKQEDRKKTGFNEFDRVLGGGIVSGSLTLIGGEPGIGKSTLLLQVAYEIAKSCCKVLIVSGEESASQISLRANRLGAISENLLLLSEVDITQVDKHTQEIMPNILIIDSIQTMYHPDVPSAPGSVSQVRECTHYLMRIAKGLNVPTFIVGHVTKDGSIAGPRVLEHMVDTVLYFEGENYQSFRILRAVKNRYGSTNEIGIFEMTESGLQEVSDPSTLLLSQKPSNSPGSTIISTIEGTRPLLVELQALVTASHLSMPRRMATGLDYNRLLLMVAVLDRRCGLHLGSEDIYVNIVGGVKVNEPAVDLGIALAIASAHRDLVLPSDMVVIGEVGLSGEVRYVNQIDKRLKEAIKLGLSKAIVPDQEIRLVSNHEIELIKVKNIQQALNFIS